MPIEGIRQVYARTGLSFRGDGIDEDVIGILQLEFEPWQERRPAVEIFAEIEERTAGLAGIHVEQREEEAGPPVGKPIQIEIGSTLPDRLPPVVETIRSHVDQMTGSARGHRQPADPRHRVEDAGRPRGRVQARHRHRARWARMCSW